MHFDLDPNDGLTVAALTTISTLTAIIVLVLVGLAATGCAHLPGVGGTTAPCEQVLRRNPECQPLGSEASVVADGVGFAYLFMCPTEPPSLLMIGLSDSPTLLAGARESGARDAGTCVLGEHEYSVVVFQKTAPDLRAGGAK